MMTMLNTIFWKSYSKCIFKSASKLLIPQSACISYECALYVSSTFNCNFIHCLDTSQDVCVQMFGKERQQGCYLYEQNVLLPFWVENLISAECWGGIFLLSMNVFLLKSKITSVCIQRFTTDFSGKRTVFNGLLCWRILETFTWWSNRVIIFRSHWEDRCYHCWPKDAVYLATPLSAIFLCLVYL